MWSFDLGVSTQSTPVVSEFGYILPGMRQVDSSTVNYVGILKDNGTSASWAFKTSDYVSQSMGAVGTANRFVLLATRASDNAQVLLVVNPKFGVISQTPVTIAPQPGRSNGVIIDQKGWVYTGTWGSSAYRAFSPTYETAVR